MVDVAGFEPATSRMRTERSPTEPHAHIPDSLCAYESCLRCTLILTNLLLRVKVTQAQH